MCSFCVLHQRREILQNEASLGEGPIRGQGLEYLLDKERLSEAGGERRIKGSILLIWTENNKVNYSMAHFKKRNMLSMSSVAIFSVVRGKVAV